MDVLQSAILIILYQAGMFYCMEMFYSPWGRNNGLLKFIVDDLNGGFSSFLGKFLTCIAAHLTNTKLYHNSMKIMKYTVNHSTRFDYQPIAFLLGF